MALVWTPAAVPGAISVVLLWALAAMVYRARPHEFQNRVLAAMLFFDGLTVGTGGGWMYLNDDPGVVVALQAFVPLAMPSLVAFYLLFASTMKTRLVAWITPRPVRWGLIGLTFLGPLLYLSMPTQFVTGVTSGGSGPYEATYGPLWAILPLVALAAGLFALPTTILNYRNQRDGPLRDQARRIMMAFIVRDATFILMGVLYGLLSDYVPASFSGMVLPAVGLILYALMLSFAILRSQVFGIELTIKRNVVRGAIVAPFLVVFFLAAETLEGVLGGGSYLAGLAAAAVLSLAVVPLRRGANRFADWVLPGVEDTASYRAARAQRLYDAAVHAANSDGAMTAGERAALDRLAKDLGLAAN